MAAMEDSQQPSALQENPIHLPEVSPGNSGEQAAASDQAAPPEQQPSPDLVSEEHHIDVELIDDEELTEEEAKAVAEQLAKSQVFACIFSVPIAAICVLVLSTNLNQGCDAYLHVWILGVALFQFVRFPFRIIFIRSVFGVVSDLTQEPATVALSRTKRQIPYLVLSCLNIAAIAWYAVGVIEVFRPSDCSEKAPEVYKLSLALVIIFLSFLAFSCACRCLFICIMCWHRPQSGTPTAHDVILSFPNAGAEDAAITGLAAFKFGHNRVHPERDMTCAICLADFTQADDVTRLPCGHLFHTEEIKVWLKQRGACPLCNDRVTAQKVQLASQENSNITNLDDDQQSSEDPHHQGIQP